MRFAAACALFVAISPAAAQQGLDAKRNPEDYPVHGSAGDVTVAAEFHYRALQYRGDNIFLREGLVVEVALYAPEKRRLDVNSSKFWLRVNGKNALVAVNAGLVLSQERLGNQPALDIQVMDGGIRLGGPDSRRYPDEPSPAPPPRVEDPNRPPREAPRMDQLLNQLALPEGKRTVPIAGLVYFHYKKKVKSIKKLELIYESPTDETVALKIR